MEEKVLILDFTGTAGKIRCPAAGRLSFRELPGTDGYCSEEAAGVLRSALREKGAGGIHFLDSGNYHYLSKFFLEQITIPFDLVVFDHHTDMQPPALLPLLSCGNWLLETFRENRLLGDVWLIGPPEDAPAALEEIDRKRLHWISAEELKAGRAARRLEEGAWERPLYLSLDKDVLCRAAARTNWDQGELQLEELCGLLRILGSRAEWIGVDLCGAEVPGTAEAETINSRTDERLMECIKEIMKLGR